MTYIIAMLRGLASVPPSLAIVVADKRNPSCFAVGVAVIVAACHPCQHPGFLAFGSWPAPQNFQWCGTALGR